MRVTPFFTALLLTLAGCASTQPRTPAAPVAVVVVAGVLPAQLDPGFWIQRQPDAHSVVFGADAIAAQNQRLQALDPSVHDLRALPNTLTRDLVRSEITTLSKPPRRTLYAVDGAEITGKRIASWVDGLNLAAIPPQQPMRYGLVTRRADLRTFPTTTRVFSNKGDTDIDRFQESALFPGTPVAVLHESRDRKWWFVVSPMYAAWIEKQHVAIGTSEQVFGYVDNKPYVVVTDATVRTVHTPELPAVSELQLDMGVRVPLLTGWPSNRPVNGQHPHSAHVIELPIRGPDGALQFSAALLPNTADVATRYLPLTRANVIKQGFRFLGERYGWGHAYNARDCSGFVSEVYRSFGVQMPRNTGGQAGSPAFNTIRFAAADDRGKRLAAVRDLQVGDLIYIPGHVMMVIGHDNGQTYVIHDTAGVNVRDANGAITRLPLNAVSVTALEPLQFNGTESFIDRIDSVVRMRR